MPLPQTVAMAATMDDAPKFVEPQTDAVPKGTRVDVLADRLTYDGKSEIARATGTVQLTYGPYVLTATEVVYDMKKGKFRANGSIVFREPNGNVMEADFAELEETFKEGFARHVKALLTNDVTITAQYARRYENGVTVYEKATYTACKTCVDEGGNPLWQIVAREAKHDMETRTMYYRDAHLEIGGVPLVYTPYFSYPDPSVKRRTGFLLPSFHGGSYGIGVTTPFFWEVAPNKDVTFSPMWTTRQGPLADAEWRHRLASGIYSIRGAGIHELDRDESDAADGPWRGGVRTKGAFEINDTWDWGWDGTLTSDRGFLSDYDLDNRNMAASYVQTTGLADRNYAKAQIIGWRTLTRHEEQDELPIALPFVTANYIFGEPVGGGELSLDFNAYSLTRRDAVDKHDLGTEQTHAFVRAKWQRQMVTGMGLLATPFAEVRTDAYIAQNVPGADGNEDPDIYLMPQAGFDVRMPFIADHGFAQGVMTPVVQLIAAPAEQRDDDAGNEDAITINFDTTSLFLSDRFTGFDRYEGGVRANVGLTYTLMGEDGGFVRTSFGESFHIAGENSFLVGSGLNGTSSDLVGAIALQLFEGMTLGYQARIEEDLSRINVQEASLGLTFDRFSGSLSYADVAAAANYGRPDHEEQVWGDGKFLVGEAWSLFGGFRYDIEGNKFMDKTIGVAFECECMRAQLAYSESREDDDGTERRIEVGVELRTIGAVNGGFQF
ncbi:LPS-assembly protein LptD [Aestuariivirga sp.]|uniref:LPS-assembly protein LptD n=1 Tax=Aestuariivirga sp. TaxID=2650926 RepID=UPI00359453D1